MARGGFKGTPRQEIVPSVVKILILWAILSAIGKYLLKPITVFSAANVVENLKAINRLLVRIVVWHSAECCQRAAAQLGFLHASARNFTGLYDVVHRSRLFLFDRDWKQAASQEFDGMEGRWIGRWHSDYNQHNGVLRCLLMKRKTAPISHDSTLNKWGC